MKLRNSIMTIGLMVATGSMQGMNTLSLEDGKTLLPVLVKGFVKDEILNHAIGTTLALLKYSDKASLPAQEQQEIITNEVLPLVELSKALRSLNLQAQIDALPDVIENSSKADGVKAATEIAITAEILPKAATFVVLFDTYMKTNDTRLGRMVKAPKA